MPRSSKVRVPLALSLLGCACLGAAPHAAAAVPVTWYVSATATPGGDGSRQHPFATLLAVELASAAGDTIVVLPAPLSVPPLDGGILLKARQKLIGEGPSVVGKVKTKGGGGGGGGGGGLTSAPRITNTHPLLNFGEGVILADDSEVTNLVVTGTYRSGILALEATGINIHGNEVVNANTSCTDQLSSDDFIVPTTTPGVGLTKPPHTLGVAGIAVDELLLSSGSVSVTDNLVHDGTCGDGIDLHTDGGSVVDAVIARNTVTRIHNGGDQDAVGAVGVAALGTSQLTLDLDSNVQTYIGTTDADSEGIYLFPGGTAQLSVTVRRNYFAHGIGGDSANGLEYTILNGTPTANVTVSDSSFRDTPGDMLEEFNLSEGSTMHLKLDHVSLSDTTGAPSVADLPYNHGDCFIVMNGGASTTTTADITHSKFTHCVNNGLTAFSNVVNGTGPATELAFTVDDSTIRDNAKSNLQLSNLTDITTLSGKVQKTDLSRSDGSNTGFNQEPGVTAGTTVDLGGGALGSLGGNCLDHPGNGVSLATNIDVSAQRDWWGQSRGPRPGQIVTSDGATVSFKPVLSRAPRGCGGGLWW